MTDETAYQPPTTVAELRRILDQLPGGMPVLVDGYEAAYAVTRRGRRSPEPSGWEQSCDRLPR